MNREEESRMVQRQTGKLKHREMKSRIGSEVLSGKDELLSGRHADEIRALLEQRAFSFSLGSALPRAN